jgi:hypothetical protein
MPQYIPPGLTREHVLRAIADLDAGIDHPFGPATVYELVHKGNPYPPKAVVGLACRYVTGEIRLPSEFSSGVAPGQAVYVLRKLGFTVVKKDEEAGAEDDRQGKDWSEQEVRLIVADYFEMLERELLGNPFSKAEHRRGLVPRLAGRSDGSIEFKHQNISAVLTGLGLPYIEGYKLRGNFQALLGKEVEAFLDQHPGFLDQAASAPVLNPEMAPATESLDMETVFEDPPDRITTPKEPEKPWLSRKGRRIDFAQRDALNRRLANLGEEFVVQLERRRLVLAGSRSKRSAKLAPFPNLS